MPRTMPQAAVPLAWLFFVAAMISATGCGVSDTSATWEALLEEETIVIAVTDSGLGGLSIVADTERKLRELGVYADVELIFYNALFSAGDGYNSLPDRDEKIRVFSRALQGLQDRYAPNIILIACNTLSVLYQDTEFAATTKTPVVGIVEDGVDLIAERMLPRDDSRTIIFATRTTVEENTHQASLVEKGISEDRIISQACPELASYIERGFDSMETAFLIDAYVDEAVGAVAKNEGPLYVSFNCTHYGYALDAWRDAFSTRGISVTEFINPNTTMIDFLLPTSLHDRHETVSVDIRVVSMVELTAERRASLGRYLRDVSPATANALDDYELIMDLFTWRDVLDGPAAR